MPVSCTNAITRIYLVSCQDPEGCHNLLGCVRISSLSGHKVNERLEGDDSSAIGVYQHHYTGKLHLSLKKKHGWRMRRVYIVYLKYIANIKIVKQPLT